MTAACDTNDTKNYGPDCIFLEDFIAMRIRARRELRALNLKAPKCKTRLFATADDASDPEAKENRRNKFLSEQQAEMKRLEVEHAKRKAAVMLFSPDKTPPIPEEKETRAASTPSLSNS